MNLSNQQSFSRKGEAEQGNLLEDTKVFKRIKGKRANNLQLALVVISGPDQGREFLLAPVAIKIGRLAENYIKLNDPKASREHAILEYSSHKKTFLLKDLGSTNGTYCNKRRIESTFVFPGDEIGIGESVLKVISLQRESAEINSKKLKPREK
jgi:pSer/pThr/pTyr-binding forkhead associated (FHA) protein